MNDDTNSLHPWIEPELEARLTALVLGEASDFECDELERLIADRPELALYRKRLEAMHRMLREVATGESAEEQGEWKLGAERREAVLARLHGERSVGEKVVVMSGSRPRFPWRLIGRIAACFAVIGLVLSLILRSLTTVLGDAERPKNNGMAFTQSDGRETLSRSDGSLQDGQVGVGVSGRYGVPLDGSDLGKFRSAQKEWRHYPLATEKKSEVERERQELALADRAIRTPAPTSATPAPPAEPMVVTRSGQTDVSNGTVALRSGSLTITGGIEVNSTAGRRLEGEASGFGLKDANTYTGGLVINSGGVAITNPEPAAPVDVKKGYDRIDTMTRGRSATTDGDGDGLDRDGLADSRTGEKAKTQPGQVFAEEERMKSLQSLSETTGTLAQDMPDASIRNLSEKEVAELAQVEALKAMPESDEKPVTVQEKFKLDVSKGDLAPREMPLKAGEADDFGNVTFGQTGAAAVPAPPAKPMPVAAATASGPAAASEPVAEQPLTKVGAGTLAMNGGFTGVGGFVDVEGRKEAASNRPASSANLNFTGDTQVNAGTEAKGNVAMNGWADTAGAAVDRKNVDAYDFVTPLETDRLSRAEKEVAKEGEDAPLRGVSVEKSMEESLAQGGEVVAVERKRLAENESKGELQKNGVSANAISSFSTSSVDVPILGAVAGTTSPVGTINFGAGVSSIETLSGFFEVTEIEKREEFQKTGDANVALPGLQSDKKTFGFSVQAGSQRKDAEVTIDEPWMFRRAGEVDQSVADIMALTPQVGKDEHLFTRNFLGGATGLRGFDYRDVAAKDPGQETAVGVDYGIPLDESKLTSEGRFQFTMGDSFGDESVPAKAEAKKPTPAALAETSPSAEPFSTFSLHVSDVSFQLAKASLASGKWPEAEKIRIEEFVNAFDYGDPMPGMGERVACRIDQGAHPFLQQRNLVRIALRTAEAGRSAGTPLRLTLLLDSSGSMERPDRRATLTRAVATLAGLLGENDRVTLVSFARQPRLVADAVPGNEAMKLAETAAALPSEGGTNLEAALQLAFEKAREHQEPNAQNRIVLLTDGAANLGDAKAESLGQRVELMREAGIAFDAAGFGAEGLNDEILEALTRKGDGRYYLLDRPEDAEDAFAKQIAGALRPAAKNVKVQVEFNPDRVKSYKLLGFEKHRLATEDFRNDAVDAAELAAAEAGVAVYQVEPMPGGEGDLGSVSVRFRDLDSGEMVERRWGLAHLPAAPAADEAGDAILLATVASQFAAKLAGGPVGDVVDLGELARLAAELPESERVKELRTMIEQARGLEGER